MTAENSNGRSVLKKGLFIILAVLVLQIPVLLIKGLINDREDISSEAETEVSKQWGGSQTIYPPELRIPYKVKKTDSNGNFAFISEVKTLQPEEADVNGYVKVTTLKRSIYEIPVYQADMKIDGSFVIDEDDVVNHDGKIYLYLPVGETMGIEDNITAVVDGKDYMFDLSEAGLRVELETGALTAGQEIQYSINLKTRGAAQLNFRPKAATFKVNLTSDHPSPGFNGDFLPVERNVTDNGFEAKWVVTDFNTYGVINPQFHVELVVPVSQYQQTTRATKYSFLIIIFVMVAIFLVETVSRQEVTYIQYVVTGLSLCLFYLLLLSISEYLAFSWAYLIASGMTVVALGGYFIGFLRSGIAIACTTVVAALYGFIYILLNLETGSLLVGSLALFAILSVIMYFTRKNN